MTIANPQFLFGSDYLRQPRDPQKWVLQDLIPVGGLVNMYGRPKSGKSMAALGMAHAISTGQPWLEFETHKPGPVAFFQIDTPRGEWADRLANLDARGYDISKIAIADMLMTPTYPFNILDQSLYKWLTDQMAAIKPVVVFIDTIREIHGADENDSTVMRNVVTQIVSACLPAAIVLLSHSRKDTEFSKASGGDLMGDARGSGYIAGKMDMIMQFRTKGSPPNEKCGGMRYKGRSKGQGDLTLTQDPDTGLIIFDGEAAAFEALVKAKTNELRAENPKIAIDKIATVIEHLTTYRKHRAITTAVNRYLNELTNAEG